MFDDIKSNSDKDESKPDETCYDIDTTDNTCNENMFDDIKADSSKDEFENDATYYNLDQSINKKAIELEYNSEKFDNFLKALFDKINETQKNEQYDLEFLKDEMKKEVGKKIIKKDGTIKVKIKIFSESFVTFLEENYNFRIIKKGKRLITIILDVNQNCLLDLANISYIALVDKIELA